MPRINFTAVTACYKARSHSIWEYDTLYLRATIYISHGAMTSIIYSYIDIGECFFFETVTSAYHLPNLGNKKGGNERRKQWLAIETWFSRGLYPDYYYYFNQQTNK